MPTARLPRIKADQPLYFMLRRLSGEIVLVTGAELHMSMSGHAPVIHDNNRDCYASPPYKKHNVFAWIPKKPKVLEAERAAAQAALDADKAAGKEVHPWDYRVDTDERVERPCKCRCHTRAGKAAHKAELVAYQKANVDPANRRFSVGGGESQGNRLAGRTRLFADAELKRLLRLDAQITRLQHERNALVRGAWAQGTKLTPALLAKVAERKPQGPTHYQLAGVLDARWAFPEGEVKPATDGAS